MNSPRLYLAACSIAVVLSGLCLAETDPTQSAASFVLDHRYAPSSWQTAICLPDDWQKTLVHKDGTLLYDFGGKHGGFGTRIRFRVDGDSTWAKQELVSACVPIVRTIRRAGALEITEEVFAAAPPSSTRSQELTSNKPARRDILWVRLRNTGTAPASVNPTVEIETSAPFTQSDSGTMVHLGNSNAVVCSEAWSKAKKSGETYLLRASPVALAAGEEHQFAIAVDRGGSLPGEPLLNLGRVRVSRKAAQRYWEKLDLPYHHLQVPDPGVQDLIDSATRNIYQAREIKNGLPAFQVGPTCYRGLWVVDGSFLLEAVTYLGRANETRDGIRYLMSFQRPDGGFMLIDGHWKETGIVLWAVARHAQLTGDKNWLREVWPKVERGFGFIRQMRRMPAKGAPNADLIPDGFSDGGLAGKNAEYTNIYWTLAGMQAAVEAAAWLGLDAQAAEWRQEYEDFLSTFRRAASRDLRKDSHGNSYLPIRMIYDEKIPPQKAQWAFLHAVFPGRVFAADDPLVQGNMAMLKSVETEGLVLDTGWLKDGIWTYFGSFYGHAWLWLGDGDKAARTLYAFGNHASPLLAWREEQMPSQQNERVVGDMPHNWASAEFIRLVRHSLVLERGADLHLLEGMPAAWAKPGATTRVKDVATSFGPVSFELRVAADGKTAKLKLSPPHRTRPDHILLHLDHWSGRNGTMGLPTNSGSTTRLKL
jgi:hypothetical protein